MLQKEGMSRCAARFVDNKSQRFPDATTAPTLLPSRAETVSTVIPGQLL